MPSTSGPHDNLNALIAAAVSDASEEMEEVGSEFYHDHQRDQKYQARKQFLEETERRAESAASLLGEGRDDIDDLYERIRTDGGAAQPRDSLSPDQVSYLRALASVEGATVTFEALEEPDDL